MKKLLLIPLLILALNSYGQDTTIFYPKVSFNKNERILYVNSLQYQILSQEEIGNNFYRIFLYQNGSSFDCIWSKKKFVSITKLK